MRFRGPICLAIFFSVIELHAAQTLTWTSNLADELKAAAADEKPVLILVRHPAEIGAMDVSHWLREDSVQPLLEKFRRVSLWHSEEALKPYAFAPRAGFLVLNGKGEPLAIEDIPLLRAHLKPLLEKFLEAKPLDEATKAALAQPNAERQFDRMLQGINGDLKAQFKEALKCVRAAQNDKTAEARAKEIVTALLDAPLSDEDCMRTSGLLMYIIMELDFDAQRLRLAEKIHAQEVKGRVAADAFLDLADHAIAKGDKAAAEKFFADAETVSANGESPVFNRTARAMRNLIAGTQSPTQARFVEREVLDVVVLVKDLPSFASAISHWNEKRFFPVLFQDDLYAPKFIAAFKPSKVIVIPPAEGDGKLSEAQIVGAVTAGCGHKGSKMKDAVTKPDGVVFTDGTSGEVAGAIALAAGRFQPLEILPPPPIATTENAPAAGPREQISLSAAREFSAKIYESLKRWGLPHDDAWAFVTLAGSYPYRYTGLPDGYNFGSTYSLDDLIGRDEDNARVAVTGCLIGDNARSAYQAACSLFLQPHNALLFNTYGTNPKSIWGAYRMSFSEEAWKGRLEITHLHDADAKIESFRKTVAPWNRFELITINSSGGTHDWSVGGGGGTSDDFPVGVPCAIHVTHSGSAGNPYDNDTLAGRAIWGGAYFYFGSVAEPFLSSFQPPSYYAPRIAAGAPLAAAFRQRPGQYFGYPWRLMIIGDPQFAPLGPAHKRVEYKPKNKKDVLIANGEQTLGEPEGTPPLARALEAQLIANDPPAAFKQWQDAQADSRNEYTCRVYARESLATQLDRAYEKEELNELLEKFPLLLSTNPARNFSERWCDKICALAEKKNERSAAMAWLTKNSVEAQPENFRGLFASRITKLKLSELKSKSTWSPGDKAEALRCLGDCIKQKGDKNAMLKQLEEVSDLAKMKINGATVESVTADIKALFPGDSDDGKRLEGLLKELEAKRAQKK